MNGLTAPSDDQMPFPEDRPALNLTDRLRVDTSKNEVYFEDFGSQENGKIFWWRLPYAFEGHKVTAYGGKLRFTVSYKPASACQVISSVSQGDQAATKLVRLYGNNFELLSKINTPDVSEFKAPDYKLSYDILINEANWLYISGDSFQEKSREELLLALSDISHIHILATFGTVSERTALSDVSLTVADPTGNGEPAPEVENCDCYRAPHTEGTSCEVSEIVQFEISISSPSLIISRVRFVNKVTFIKPRVCIWAFVHPVVVTDIQIVATDSLGFV